ncbi:DUF4199 domain-containing protein [Flavobacteriaceae bacterium 14752]|uniref:DUF4199 domain-containing protein n=1 Tax=Mesohalobacter salilacus TaxID=2491711 RepID=UPI000F63615B|nr:DUF4199 domain-containing protein [Flavobacteriaceae bacterium 14752]
MFKIKTEFKWTIIFIIMSLLWIYLEKITGLHHEYIEYQPIYTNIYAIPAILIYVLALKEKKQKFYNGVMSYKNAFISGLILTLMISLLSPLSTYASVEYISPGFFNNAIEKSVELEMMTKPEALDYFNTQNYMLQSLMFAPVFGIVTTAIVAIFVRTKSK